nr:uncharacterized protein LOC129261571 [Lytechinus pictus]
MRDAGDSDFYYIGSLRRFNDKDYQLSKVEVNPNASIYSAQVETDTSNDRYIWDRTSFVGSIMRGQFIYFFYREKAREYSNIGNIVYSRVARVCKNDTGGTGTLNGNFLTFLKTRLMCSVGSGYPFIFNEIQDVFQSPSNENLMYGLFTNPNAGLSSTAICRYDMSEIDKLFNEGTRRGQASADMQWQSIPRDADDTVERRSCSEAFPPSLNTYLINYPLMNTNAPNCGLTTLCDDYTRESDEALAVFEGIRGQQLVVFNDTGLTGPIQVYVGTNNNTVFEASITNSAVTISKQFNIKVDISMFTDAQLRNKWPFAVTYLGVNGNDIIGTLDNMVFQFTPDTTEGGQILDRSPSVYEVYFPEKVPNAKVEIFKLFEGPSGSDITASFSKNYMHNCSQNTFKSTGSGKREFLAVLCEISEVSGTLNITVSSDSLGLNNTFSVAVVLDKSKLAECDPSEVNKYDHEMAEYRYDFKQWLNSSVTCDDGTKETCPSASKPGI